VSLVLHPRPEGLLHGSHHCVWQLRLRHTPSPSATEPLGFLPPPEEGPSEYQRMTTGKLLQMEGAENEWLNDMERKNRLRESRPPLRARLQRRSGKRMWCRMAPRMVWSRPLHSWSSNSRAQRTAGEGSIGWAPSPCRASNCAHAAPDRAAKGLHGQCPRTFSELRSCLP
jgi:hypothetical protein